MSSTASTTSSNNGNTKSNTCPTSAANGLEFTQEQWLDLLRVLPHSSRKNLQLALQQFLQETLMAIESEHLDLKTPLPDASTLVHAPLLQDDLLQNTFATDHYVTLLRQSLNMDHKPMIATTTVDALNGLDTLAAAALANTSAETNATSTAAVTVLQGKAVSAGEMVPIPITTPITPGLLGSFKTDSSRQSPTIRETPKRLAVTRAEAEQAAEQTGQGDSVEMVKRSRLTIENTLEETDVRSTVAITAASLLTNGVISASSILKPDPECVSNAYSFLPVGSDATSNWNLSPVSVVASAVSAAVNAGSGILTESNRRRTRDEGITDDEAARREKRRERNRVAAAKCRQNRQNQIEELKTRRKLLEDEGNHTRQLIQNLLHEKAQMEGLLKKHAQSGCPSAAQCFENGTLLLRFSTPASSTANTTSKPDIRIIQPGSQLSHSNPATSSLAQTISSPAVIKSEALNASPPPTFMPPQRPNTLSLATSTKAELPKLALDPTTTSSTTTAHLATQLWSPSVAEKLKTPGGESWVNSQIGLPPITVGTDKESITSSAALTTTRLSTSDILHQFGISLTAVHRSSNTIAGKSANIQICGSEGTTITSPSISVSVAPPNATTSTKAAMTNIR